VHFLLLFGNLNLINLPTQELIPECKPAALRNDVVSEDAVQNYQDSIAIYNLIYKSQAFSGS